MCLRQYIWKPFLLLYQTVNFRCTHSLLLLLLLKHAPKCVFFLKFSRSSCCLAWKTEKSLKVRQIIRYLYFVIPFSIQILLYPSSLALFLPSFPFSTIDDQQSTEGEEGGRSVTYRISNVDQPTNLRAATLEFSKYGSFITADKTIAEQCRWRLVIQCASMPEPLNDNPRTGTRSLLPFDWKLLPGWKCWFPILVVT